MKLVGFAVMRNPKQYNSELFLDYWFNSMGECDHIYIYDLASDDGSQNLYKKYEAHQNLTVINSTSNHQGLLQLCRRITLQKILNEQPDTDWIFCLDQNNLLDGRLYGKVKQMLSSYDKTKADGLKLGYYKLWRSDTYYRVDNNHNHLDKIGRTCFWKNNGNLEFLIDQSEVPYEPSGLSNILSTQYKLIGYEMSTDGRIIMANSSLNSVPSEEGMITKRMDNSVIPKGFQVKNDMDPTKELSLSQFLT